ncbi:MAG: FapA family protein [Bacteroides sp.]|nr:FapA family protein [Eubacterium sp.]MCM1418383.1 FapA family protein [Roseburia sp.]MCM1462484.1 FapA family protein [Bacteroides sp.]
MPEPINGTITFNIDDRSMNARVIVTSPRNGGLPVTYKQLCDEVTAKGIRHNLDEDALKSIFEENIFDKSILIAKGDPPIDGKNGTISYHFEMKETQELEEDEFGNVDFRNLGFIRNIDEGTVIADIIPETPGVPGTDIRGVPVPQYGGKPATFTVGTGVVLSEDGSRLLAATAGNLRWNKTHFVVDKEVVIGGDVDASIGNIDFIGNILVKGDVKEGYIIKSHGNITVKGNVTGAQLIAFGDISIQNGAVSSEVEGMNVTAGFFENTHLSVRGNLTAQSLVACKVHCTGTITAKSGKGVIVGGKLTCLSDITANIIGSDTYTHTSIVLGNAAVLAEERIELVKKMDEYTTQLDKLGKICTVLQEQKKTAALSAEREEMLTTSIRAKYVHFSEIRKIRKRIEQIEEELINTNDLAVHIQKSLYPGVTVRIGYSRYAVSNIYGKCRVGMNSNGEIEVR